MFIRVANLLSFSHIHTHTHTYSLTISLFLPLFIYIYINRLLNVVNESSKFSSSPNSYYVCVCVCVCVCACVCVCKCKLARDKTFRCINFKRLPIYRGISWLVGRQSCSLYLHIIVFTSLDHIWSIFNWFIWHIYETVAGIITTDRGRP